MDSVKRAAARGLTGGLMILGMAALGWADAGTQVDRLVASLVWTGQASVMVPVAGKVVWIDPLMIPKGSPVADLILITHSHQDHLSPADIQMVASEKQTTIAGPADVIAKLGSFFKGKTVVLTPLATATINGVKIQTVSAYNVVKTNFHAKSSGWLGYILEADGGRLYHTGDTERIPEMKGLAVDVIMLPLGQTYTMNSVQEAVDAVRDSGAKVAIPIHFGLYEGTEADAQSFEKLLKDTTVKYTRLTQKK